MKLCISIAILENKIQEAQASSKMKHGPLGHALWDGLFKVFGQPVPMDLT